MKHTQEVAHQVFAYLGSLVRGGYTVFLKGRETMGF